MFGRILVATDLTVATRTSLRAALELVRRDEGEVVLAHVVRRIAGIADRELRDFYARLRTDAKRRMLELSAPFARERGVEIVCEVAMGQPAQELVRMARALHADLIVLAHRAGGGRAPLGSVSYTVTHVAPCSVLLLNEPAPTSRVARRASPRPPVRQRARPA
jgi:nucleotide-binding universal stress UspA family protein